MKYLNILLFSAMFCFNSKASTIYVNLNATGTNTGADWTNAFVDLQSAIALSVFGDEIWVAQGTYKPTTGTTRSASFSIKNGTKVYGGFTGVETLLSQRNVVANVTVLSGEIGAGSASDNSYTVVYFSNVANQTRLDGFTVTSGYHNGVSAYGAGAKVVSSSPTIANCKFQGNYAEDGGGAIDHSISGVLTLESCVFDGNVGNTYGGGALRSYTGTVNISNCYFKSNQSNTYAGAIYFYDAIVNISNSVFAGNYAESTGSAIRIGDLGTLHLSNSLLVGNYTNQTGTITTSTFSNTSAHTIKNCTIAHNKHDNSSGSSTSSAVALNNEASITNSIIYGNNSTNQVLSTGLTFNYNITQASTNNATGTANLLIDPLFAMPGTFAAAPFDTTGFDYRLQILSQGIDAGSNTTAAGTLDLAGNARIYNNIVDLGAYESSFCSSTSQFTTAAPYTMCGGASIILEVIDGANLIWSNGSTSNAITVSIAGNYSVILEDINGCRGELTANVTTSANPVPVITYALGNLQTGVFSSYQWFFNGTIINGATNSSHTPIEGYGQYEVVVQNASGCEGSTEYCLSPATISADGPTSFCQGENVQLTVVDGNSYVWSTGSLSSSITVNSSGTYSVTVLNSTAGCSVNLSQVVTANPNPNPVISFNGLILTTGTFTSYQWNYNGSPIAGATSQNINPTATGNGQYSVTVTNSNGCEVTSAVFNLTDLSINDNEKLLFSYYPNPTNGSITIASGVSFNRVEVLNALGQKVSDYEMSETSNYSLTLPEENGVYILKIYGNESQTIKRVVKQ